MEGSTQSVNRLIRDIETLQAGQHEIEKTLVSIAVDIAVIKQRLDGLQCAQQSRRIERLEGVVGKQNLVAALVGAMAGGVVLAIKHLTGR